MPGTTTDTSTLPDPTVHVRQPGRLQATLTVTDGQGGTTAVKPPRSASPLRRAAGRGYRDDFDGTDLGAGWDVVRRDQGLVVSGGTLKMPTAPGDVYGGDDNTEDVTLRAAPSGPGRSRPRSSTPAIASTTGRG